MKKTSNDELKENYSTLKHVKEGKIQKKKQKTVNKLKDAVCKTVDFDLAPKKLCSNFPKNSDDGNITKKSNKFKIGLPKAAKSNGGNLVEQKTQSKDIKNKHGNRTPSEEKTEADLKKIEKKKAKKLAQKLKKKQKKAQGKDFPKLIATSLNNEQEGKSLGKKTAIPKKGVSEDHNKKQFPLVNGKQKSQNLKNDDNENVEATIRKVSKNQKEKDLKKQSVKDQKLETAENKNVNETGQGKLLPKKEKKALKKQLKDEKQETDDNKNDNATSSAVLTKKELKALKRQLIKDQKQETAGSKNVDATSSEVLLIENKKSAVKTTKDQKQETLGNKTVQATSNKVLTKKENKALKRQLIKEQKLSAMQTRNPVIMEATVFVGNLPVNTKRAQLVHVFKKVGPVNSIRFRSAAGKVLLKHKQRKLAGSLNAYVVLQSKEKAEKALSLNGFEFKGNHLRVTLAKKPEIQDSGESKRTVFVGNLKYSATEESLREIFSSCGEVEYVRCIRDGEKGCKGVAYVCFKNADAVGLALELNETIVDERSIHVERYNVKKLGAKQAREEQAEKEMKSKSGGKLRLEGKKAKKEKLSQKSEVKGKTDEPKMSKKSEFRGVKVEGLKKKQKSKKKKSNDQMLQLAKKIAPKPKNQ